MHDLEIDVYSYVKFEDFLNDLSQLRGKRGGMKGEIAKAMEVHPAALSRVLSGQAHMTLEQAEKMTHHFHLGHDETRFVLFLLEEDRAGSHRLKSFFRQERSRILESRTEIKKRIPKSADLGVEETALYYSAWYFQAIHVLACTVEHTTAALIARRLNLPLQTVSKVVAHLEAMNLILRKDEAWQPGPTHLHLDRSSDFSRTHHANWRNHSIHRLDRSLPDDLRYTGVLALSIEDAGLLRDNMLKQLNGNLEFVQKSGSEKAFVYCLDFFEV